MTVAAQTWLEDVQRLITNRLDASALAGRRVAAILGDVPSTYAKSPKLWNATFRALELPATYVSLDIPAGRLADVVQVLRRSDTFLGGSVTVPYKMEIVPLLDAVDPLAAQIGAVNTIVRSADGQLTGYNTDGLGGVNSLASVCPTLTDARVLLLGAGGAAQAMAFFLAQAIGPGGALVLANRERGRADGLAQRVNASQLTRARVVDESRIGEIAPTMTLIVNATTKGQAGWRRVGVNGWILLEPYSSLAPASPTVIDGVADETERATQWFAQSRDDIAQNQARSMEMLARTPVSTVCYDIVYAPVETVFLRHARWSGHRTLNGKRMNIGQAVAAFTQYVCRDWLAEQGGDAQVLTKQVTDAMTAEWER